MLVRWVTCEKRTRGLEGWRVVGLWGSQQSFIRGGGGGEGVHLKEGPTSYPFIYHF